MMGRLLALLFAAGMTWLAIVLVLAVLHGGTDRPYGPIPTISAADCAWHDRAGHNVTPDGDTAYVTVGGSYADPVVYQYVCLHGSLVPVAGGPEWPSQPVTGG